MHAFANPARFLRIAVPLTPWLLWPGLAFVAAALASGLVLTPPDYLQGESVRIMYVHVPAAWLGMAGWMGIALASLAQIVWRHPLAVSRRARWRGRGRCSPRSASRRDRCGGGRHGARGGSGTDD